MEIKPLGPELALSPLLHRREHTRKVSVLDEELLIRKTFEEDAKQGCELLFRKYYPLLCSHAVRLVHSQNVAEDLVADLFCKLWTDRIYLNINTSFRAYLFKAIRFSAYNYTRRDLAKKGRGEDMDSFLDLSTSFKPEEALLFDELASEIGRIVDNLPPQCRTVFVMSRFENKKYLEIADELGISIKTVEIHISKALVTLRKGLKASGAAAIAGSAFLYLT